MKVTILTLISTFFICGSFLGKNLNSVNAIRKATSRDYTPATMRVIQKKGYPAEMHMVKTVDGYYLQLHRIPLGLKTPPKKKKQPVLIIHGLLGNSATFIIQGHNSLGFLLADLGYDVWLGNLRGNDYGKFHDRFSPKDSKFWDFSWHESGVYDLPAMIDYICSKTNSTKINYVGYSMGTTVFFVMTSTRPQYNDKIKKAFLMAPVAFLNHVRSPLLIFPRPLINLFTSITNLLGNGELLPHNKIIRYLSKFLCFRNSIKKKLCGNIVYLLTGVNMNKYNETHLAEMVQHFPSSYSVKGLVHYLQLRSSEKFRQYSYGRRKNVARYGTPMPPDYNLKAIRAEMYFYVSRKDDLATIKDVMFLSKKLSSVSGIRVIERPMFNHMDFIISENAKEVVYDKICKDIEGEPS